MAKALATFGVNPLLLGLARRRGSEGERAARVIREALTRGLLMWHRKMLPGHFKPPATVKYAADYTPRAKHYERDKQEEKGHRKPMVFSKKMRDTVLGNTPATKASAQGRSVRVQLQLAWHEHMKYWRGRRVTRRGATHNFDREMTAVTPAEHGKIIDFVERVTMRAFRTEFEAAEQRMWKKRFRA